jgi:hypothetical protein
VDLFPGFGSAPPERCDLGSTRETIPEARNTNALTQGEAQAIDPEAHGVNRPSPLLEAPRPGRELPAPSFPAIPSQRPMPPSSPVKTHAQEEGRGGSSQEVGF